MARAKRRMSSPVSAGNIVYRGIFPIVLVLAVGCEGCGDDTLIDISCKPGDPASGQYDRDLEELCDNLIDDNCDGNVNEGCDCLDGEESTCGTDVGECETTTVVCVGGKWPECVPNQSPRDEFCDNIDNDCDGEIDEDFAVPVACWTGPEDVIRNGTTPCREGLQYCDVGRWSDCLDQQLPQAELCDSIDNDCDGIVDDNTTTDGQPCGPPTTSGQCELGTKTCFAGESICVGATWAQSEVCDGMDNDCDGRRDEDLYRPCTTLCGEGVEACYGGRWEDCTAPAPTVEVCDGVDNDCDGDIDEDCPCFPGIVVPCTVGMVNQDGSPATCGFGLMECTSTSEWGPCIAAGTAEEVCNAWDDDCDGVIDSYTAACGDPYTAGIGECILGTSLCTEGAWGECVGAVFPFDEVCDNLDNDCDGEIDEDLDPHDKVDMVFAIDISGSMCPYTNALAQGIGDYVAAFSGSENQFAIAVFPGTGYNQVLTLSPNLTDVNTFLTALTNLGCSGGGDEPGYDALLELSDPANPHGVNWRSDAYPYIIYITDEPAQNWDSGATEANIASNMANCGLPGCSAGDAVEIYIITNMNFLLSYDDIVYSELDRVYEIDPAEHDRYTDMLREIFENVCLPPE